MESGRRKGQEKSCMSVDEYLLKGGNEVLITSRVVCPSTSWPHHKLRLA